MCVSSVIVTVRTKKKLKQVTKNISQHGTISIFYRVGIFETRIFTSRYLRVDVLIVTNFNVGLKLLSLVEYKITIHYHAPLIKQVHETGFILKAVTESKLTMRELDKNILHYKRHTTS